MKKKVLSIMLAVALMHPAMPVMAAEVEDMPTSLVEEQEKVVEETEVLDDSALVDKQVTTEEAPVQEEVVEEEDAEAAEEVVADDSEVTEEKIEEDAEVSEDEKEAIEGEVTEVPEVTEEEVVEDLEATEEEVVEDLEATEEEVVEDFEATEEEVEEDLEVTEEETVVEELEVIKEETVQEEPAELEIVAVEEDELLGEIVKNGGSSQEKATAMAYGEDYIGNFPSTDTLYQWYKFTTKSAPGYYRVHAKILSIPNNMGVYVYNSWGESLASYNYLGEDNYVAKLDPNTTYYIKTYNRNRTGNYTVRVDYIADPESDIMTSAVSLTDNKMYRATNAAYGDVDYYTFTTGKYGYYQIKAVNENVSSNMMLVLQSKYGEKLKSYDYIYPSESGYITMILEGNTTYYMYVKSRGNAGNYTIVYQHLIDNEGDTSDRALSLGEGKTYETSLCINNDVDYYKIVPGFSGRYNINLTNRSISSAADVKLYSEYGQKLKECTWVYEGDSKILQYSLEKGVTYYLSVNGNRAGNYAISYKKDFPFTDVTPLQEGHWQYEAVEYVYENGVMSGKNTTMFDPKANLTRAEFAQVLYNMEGKPWVDTWYYRDVFSDVPSDEWYTKAVIWAYSKGIVSGYPDGRYGIKDNITREQVAKMLYNYSEYKGENVSHRASISKFPDNWQVSNWAKPYVQWAVAMNMMSGKNVNGKLSLVPKGTANRAECASMISRYLQNS